MSCSDRRPTKSAGGGQLTLLVCVYQSVNSSWMSMLGGLAKFIRSFKSHLTDLSELIQVILTASCLGRFEGCVR